MTIILYNINAIDKDDEKTSLLGETAVTYCQIVVRKKY